MPANPVRLAVLGAGLNGRRTIDPVLDQDCSGLLASELLAIVDPSPDAKRLAAQKNAAWYPDFATMIRHERPEGMIVATPNQMHEANGLESVAAGVPMLVEKPIA